MLINIMHRADYIYHANSYRYSELCFQSKCNTKESIIRLKKIIFYPYFYLNGETFHNFWDLHVKASRLLIKIYEREKNLEALSKMDVDPTFYSSVYPFLKEAMERLGKPWDRGDIPPAQFGIPIKKN